MDETRRFVDFAVDLGYEDLPAEVVEQAKLCILDTIGVGLYGVTRPWGAAVAEFVRESGGSAEASLWGLSRRAPAQSAALVNGTGAHGIEMDDRSAILDIHCGASVVPAAIAAGERAHAAGKELIVAVVLGYDLAYRLSAALKALPRKGFYGSPVKSLPGVAVAASKVLGLDRVATLNAVGVAGSMAAGLREWSNDPVGTMVKRFQGGGWPSHSGVTAALLAGHGLTGPATVLEGADGLCTSFARDIEPDVSRIADRLGEDFHIMLRELKPYAAWGGSHASIDAVGAMRNRHGIEPTDIEQIEIGGSSKMFHTHEDARPRSIMAAQYSLPFVTALAFFRDLGNPASWSADVLADPRVLDLSGRVRLRLDDELERIRTETNDYGGVRMHVRLRNGGEHSVQVRHSKGTLGNPATFDDVLEKFTLLAGQVLPAPDVTRVAEVVSHLEAVDDVTDLGGLLTGAAER